MTQQSPSAGAQDVRGVIFDLDGTLVWGDAPLPGAVETVAELRARGIPFVICTQDTENDDAANVARLNRMGFGISPADIVSGGAVAADYLRARYPDAPVRIIGTQRQVRLLRKKGVRPARDDEPAPAVLIGLYPGFSAGDLDAACRLVWAGADFYAVALDRSFPTRHGLVPCTGGLVRAIEHATRRRARVFGKPSVFLADASLHRLRLPAASVLVVGDNLDVDIRMGKRIGARTALVLGGATPLKAARRARAPARPDHIFDGVADLLASL